MHAIINGDQNQLVELIEEEYLNIDYLTFLDEGAYYSYSCHDEVPFFDRGNAYSESQRHPFQKYMMKNLIELDLMNCDVWDIPHAPKIIKEEREITTPMLLLSGEFDPVTPFSWATELKSHGKTAWSKEWKGISHVVSWWSDCSGEVARDFLEAPI
ncbi:hypothetical protein CS022_05920 [Veronia nyctiphanis]|uniref:Peptidase S33 tripeptidyl aminopeptidase-like C-terminal domain-containing protein n=1 Tax=Veronia nyctiphanis TaxID=1278244 RepID=A0A4Q0YTU4_9GAMM|nr:alpha/beta hydrolase [Veronia nyctiphanis]RXJ74153.1 hypothetical protein CS022_05920 [Veronia nyctiphanis]